MAVTGRPSLPVEGVRDSFAAAISAGPVVLSAPTGSGKSTLVPTWCAADGRTLVVEPRRVACRSLASWVAALEGARLGDEVGYVVRDERRAGADSRIVFATPGVVLRWMRKGEGLPFDTVIIDEFHERGLETDLILALLMARGRGRLVVMSATVDADRIARHMGAAVIRAEGRLHPVAVRYVPGDALLPDVRGLESRILEGVRLSRKHEGHVLLFLPGKAEIARATDLLRSVEGFQVLALHGGLSLEEQAMVFEQSSRRKLIASTNVAETSLTIPDVGVVIDSGLVRRTRYINGRGYLTLVPVADDSAVQRAGRSGRTGPGTCFRLWSAEAVLNPRTPPEIHREALSPLLLASACCGARVGDLPFLDPPKEYAVESALQDQVALGALDEDQRITVRGEELFGMPIDAPLGNLLVEAKAEGCLPDAVDLVAALAVGRPIFGRNRPADPSDDLRSGGCDITALVRAVRVGEPNRHNLNGHLLREARSIGKRLRGAFDLGVGDRERQKNPDLRSLLAAALRSDQRIAHVARRRKGRVRWSNGGTEVEISKESALDQERAEAAVILMSVALGMGARKSAIVGTCASPVTFSQLVAAGLGEDRVRHATVAGKTRITAVIERVLANRVIGTREEIPDGELARDALASLIVDGRLFAEAFAETVNTLEARNLLQRLNAAGHLDSYLAELLPADAALPLKPREWLRRRIDTLGVESGEDLGLLSGNDFREDPVAPELMEWVDSRFARRVRLGDGDYRGEYDVERKEAVFEMVSGTRKSPPSLSLLPSCPGFRVKVRHHSKVWVLKER